MNNLARQIRSHKYAAGPAAAAPARHSFALAAHAALLALSMASLLTAFAAAASAQGTPAPTVLFRFDPAYQGVVEPGTERRSDPGDDAEWAENRARDLTDFYSRDGLRLLRLLADYAGAAWPYQEISAYVVRRFPTLSIQYPLTLTVGEIRQGEARQEVPAGDFLILTFAHQIAHYLLDPPPRELASVRPRGFDHPLMEEGNYRREALVNLVTYRALEDLWGRERLRKAVAEPLWASYNPEGAFVDSLRSRWAPSASRPLASWLAAEPDDGSLVALAERFESREGGEAGAPVESARAAPGSMAGNEVGLDLGQTADGRLFIAFLDAGSPAAAAGLRQGDSVVTIEGRTFTAAADAMRAVRDAWQANREVNLSVERLGKEVFFQVH